MFALFYACTAEEPDKRPSAKQILEILDRKEDEKEVSKDSSETDKVKKTVDETSNDTDNKDETDTKDKSE